jgi:uncharacterized delta-60 repeat protein
VVSEHVACPHDAVFGVTEFRSVWSRERGEIMSGRKTFLLLGASAAIVASLAVSALAAAGSLDTSFGVGGKATTDFGGTDEADGVAVQPDGRIVAAGIAGFYEGGNFALARYDRDGSLDTSFGGGKVTTDFGSASDFAFDVAIQPNGSIVAGGAVGYSTAGADFALARYERDGSIDPSFGVGGKVTTDFGSFDYAFAPAIQPDGRIVAAGAGSEDFAVARYNRDGSLDTSFGIGGKVTTDFGSADDFAFDVAVQPDGSIVAAGRDRSYGADFALARYQGR